MNQHVMAGEDPSSTADRSRRGGAARAEKGRTGHRRVGGGTRRGCGVSRSERRFGVRPVTFSKRRLTSNPSTGSIAAQQPTPTPARQGQVVTKVDVDILELDVLALDGKDRPVPDLTKDDFEVRIAGKFQPLEFFDSPAPRRLPGAAPDPVTSPLTNSGKCALGISLGILTFFLRFFGSLGDGTAAAIVLGNCLSPLLDQWTSRRRPSPARREAV
jgi:hypothetical protein